MPLSTGSFRIATIRGIEIRAHWSWLIIFAVLAWTIADSGFFGQYGRWSVEMRWALAILTTLLFFFSVVAHELAHSFVAQHYGMKVPSITLFAFGGVSTMATEMQTAGQEFRVAVVGPLTSWAIGLICGLGWLVLGPSAGKTILGYISTTNLVLGAFNLLPGFPLDGGRVLRSIVWGRTHDLARSTRIAANGGSVVAYGLMALGVLVLWQGSGVGLWYILIGLFLQSAARQSYREMMAEVLLRDIPARLLMAPPPTPVAGNTTLLDLVDSRLASPLDRVFLVSQGESIAGLLSISDIIRVPRGEWDTKRASEVMIPADQVVTVGPNTSIVDAMRLMQEREVHQLPVLEDGRLVGILSLGEVLRQADIRLRGGKPRLPTR